MGRPVGPLAGSDFMHERDHSLPRRSVLQGAGIGFGASLLSRLASAPPPRPPPQGLEGCGNGLWRRPAIAPSQRRAYASGSRGRRRNLVARILGQERRREAQSLAEARGRAETRRHAATGGFPGTRILGFGALLLRPPRA